MGKINLEKVSKKYKIGSKRDRGFLNKLLFLFGRESKKSIGVLKEVSFTSNGGEIVGIIGKNGSGKSTLIRIMAGIIKQENGFVKTEGKIISLINLSVGLKDYLTMKENIFLVGSLFGMGKKKIKERLKSIVDFSELNDFLETKIYQFSTGMIQRLAFSIAIYCDPEILLLDEVFEVGDENFKKKSVEKIVSLAKSGVSVVLISHDLNIIGKYCTRFFLLEDNILLEAENFDQLIRKYSNANK